MNAIASGQQTYLQYKSSIKMCGEVHKSEIEPTIITLQSTQFIQNKFNQTLQTTMDTSDYLDLYNTLEVPPFWDVAQCDKRNQTIHNREHN